MCLWVWEHIMSTSLKEKHHPALSLCSACLLQKLASVSPDLPKLVELLTVHQPKENEILLLGGLEASDTCQTQPLAPSQVSLWWCLLLLASSLWMNCPESAMQRVQAVLLYHNFVWLDLNLLCFCMWKIYLRNIFILSSIPMKFIPMKTFGFRQKTNNNGWLV